MLKDLLIQNLILMESCTIQWDPKLNVITGETIDISSLSIGAKATLVLEILPNNKH